MSWQWLLLETGGKMAAGMAATFDLNWADDRLALRARVMYRWHMWRNRHERPEGHVLCPVCYGRGSYKDHPVCSVCHVPNQPPEHRGYMTHERSKLMWDSVWWKPRPQWAGNRLTAPLPEAVVQDWTLRDQRDYREGREAPYKNWRTPYSVS